MVASKTGHGAINRARNPIPNIRCRIEFLHRILVTGYGGFLGQAICHQLIQDGYQVRGLARGNYPKLSSIGVECIQGSITDSAAVETSLRDVDAVIHTAAIAGVWGKTADYQSINIDATDLLVKRSQAAGIRAFVYTSSPSVSFDGNPQSGIDEQVPYPTKWLCDYPRTKAIAEQRVLAANHPSSFATCSLRPHLIWGVGDPHLIPRVIERCRAGRLRRVGSGQNLIDTVHVEHAAQAHVLALKKMLSGDPNASGRAYFITDDQPVACWDWITTILKCAGLKPPRGTLSVQTAYRIGSALETLYGWIGKTQEPPMTRFVALQLGVDHYFDISAAKDRLGYRPNLDRQAKIEEMRCWLMPVS
jgi:nucleoside-diphosphate-sugar epimerase